ncbi:unnamed protein product [Toxocara canis]|uniref:Kinetochore protein NDC80 n=1 Tax=Toxocara canis TaxID=6265 RepID=A0A183VAR3_TOXCA|nr:unnamed protein product [Toxocara canis]
MYGSQSSGPPSLRGRQSSSAFTPTNRTRPSRLPTSAAKTSAGRTRNDPARFSYVGSSVSSAAPSSAIKRVSSFFKTPAKQMGFKDTRNLLDREVQAAMQRKVLNFLAAADYPQLNDRLLRCPTKAEFAQMFEFIVAQLDHHYSLEGKIEEEMPRLMRNLGYPVQLKPSTMQTIGATHTMPHLLGAITWLIDAINFADKISPQEMLLSSEDDGGQRRSLAYGYTIRCYKALGDLPGNAVDHSVLERESERLANILGAFSSPFFVSHSSAVQEENDELESATEELAAREEAANEEMAEIQKLVGDSQKLEVELATSKDDYAKVMEYQNELKAGIVNAQGKQV